MDKARQTTEELLSKLETALFRFKDLIQEQQKFANNKLDLSEKDIDILKLLKYDGAKKMKDVGGTIRINLSILTYTIDRLEHRRLVKRVHSKTDRRAVYVQITPKGEKVLNDYAAFSRKLASRMKREIGEKDFAAFVENFEKIAQVPVTTATDSLNAVKVKALEEIDDLITKDKIYTVHLIKDDFFPEGEECVKSDNGEWITLPSFKKEVVLC